MARESLFIDVARDIIRNEGLTTLTMERIAELTEYSKGTVYKHFTCKEDLLCALCSNALDYLLSLTLQMASFKGRPRERLMIVGLAYQAFMEKFPEQFDLLITARNTDLRSKASQERRERVDQHDHTLIGQIVEQIQDAITQADLQLPTGVSVEDICFGAWSLSFGILSLSQAKQLNQTLVNLLDPQEALFRHLNALLDGYGWHPLSCEHDYRATMMRAQQHLEPLLANRINYADND
jgi:AcrR family transcriptional regulator